MFLPSLRIVMFCVCVLQLTSCGSKPTVVSAKETPQGKTKNATSADNVEIQMKSVNFRLAKDISLEVRSLRGQLRSTNPGAPVNFDDSSSFVVAIDSAEVALAAQSLAALLNSYVLAYPDAPIKNIEVTIKDGRVVEKGTVHKGIDLPFEIEGSLSPTADGNIRMHAEKVKSAHLPVKGLLHLFGKDLSELVNRNAGRGMTIVGDDIIMDLRAFTPPPHMQGRVSRVTVANGKIVEYFESERHPPALEPPVRSQAYIYHRGGTLRFGKLTMTDADLEIVGDRPGLFDFFQREYSKQLMAGYSKTTPSNALVTHMVDYSRF